MTAKIIGADEYSNALAEISKLEQQLAEEKLETVRLQKAWDSAFNQAMRNGEAIQELKANNEALHEAMHEIYEVWAGSEGFDPETAPEAYQQQLIKEMRDIAGRNLETLRAAQKQDEGGEW